MRGANNYTGILRNALLFRYAPTQAARRRPLRPALCVLMDKGTKVLMNTLTGVPAGPDTGGTTWREIRIRAAWEEREKDKRGKFALLNGDDSPPLKLLTPRGCSWDTYQKYEFMKVRGFEIPEPFQKPTSKEYVAPWKQLEPLNQGRTRMSRNDIHRSLTSLPMSSPRVAKELPMSGSTLLMANMPGSSTPHPFPTFA